MKAKQIKIGADLLPLPTIFELNVVEYWKNDKDGRINLELLERFNLAKKAIKI